MNKGGSEERLRGWLPVPLSPLGVKQVHESAAKFAQVIGGAPIKSSTTSDLRRALQSADILTQHTGIQFQPNTNLRDWNTGDLAGQKVVDVLPQLQHFIKNPTKSTPNGEPLQDYLNRFVPDVKGKVNDDGVHLVLGHARGATILEGVASPVGGVGGDVDPRYLLERPRVQPGGILVINNRWQTMVSNPEEKEQ